MHNSYNNSNFPCFSLHEILWRKSAGNSNYGKHREPPSRGNNFLLFHKNYLYKILYNQDTSATVKTSIQVHENTESHNKTHLA